jgi:5-methylcytosine-specific restriction endonuclease McrA
MWPVTIEELQEQFRYELWLLSHDPAYMVDFDTYVKTVARLRSQCIKWTKRMGAPGRVRILYNDALERYCDTSYVAYMYNLNPYCQLCLVRMYRHEVTKDHIVPRGKGGSNRWDNIQLAHGSCNNFKSDKLGFVLYPKVIT